MMSDEPTFEQVHSLMEKTANAEQKVLLALDLFRRVVEEPIDSERWSFLPENARPAAQRALAEYQRDGFSADDIGGYIGLPGELVTACLARLEQRGSVAGQDKV